MKSYYRNFELDKHGTRLMRKFTKQFEALIGREAKAGYDTRELVYLISSTVASEERMCRLVQEAAVVEKKHRRRSRCEPKKRSWRGSRRR